LRSGTFLESFQLLGFGEVNRRIETPAEAAQHSTTPHAWRLHGGYMAFQLLGFGEASAGGLQPRCNRHSGVTAARV
jgi:hypothetical protein